MFRYLLQKEFLQIRRNSFLPKLIFMFPIMIMCVMPWVMNMEIKNVVVEIVDNDRSTLSQQLVHQIEASHYFILKGQKSSYNEGLRVVEQNVADIIVVIPSKYERDKIQGGTPKILIAANAVNGTKGSMGSAYLSRIVVQQSETSLLSTLYLYNKNLNYKL